MALKPGTTMTTLPASEQHAMNLFGLDGLDFGLGVDVIRENARPGNHGERNGGDFPVACNAIAVRAMVVCSLRLARASVHFARSVGSGMISRASSEIVRDATHGGKRPRRS